MLLYYSFPQENEKNNREPMISVKLISGSRNNHFSNLTTEFLPPPNNGVRSALIKQMRHGVAQVNAAAFRRCAADLSAAARARLFWSLRALPGAGTLLFFPIQYKIRQRVAVHACENRWGNPLAEPPNH